MLTNSAHDIGRVVSERKQGTCTKELVVQFSLSNSPDETEPVRAPSQTHANVESECGGKVGVCMRCCVQHQAHTLLNRAAGTHLLVAIG